MNKAILVSLAILLLGSMASAVDPLDAAQDKVCFVLQQIYELLLYVASGVAALMIIAMGLTWIASADDAKARKTAKTAIVHVIVGLVIISLALVLVSLVLPEGSDCVTDWPGYNNWSS